MKNVGLFTTLLLSCVMVSGCRDDSGASQSYSGMSDSDCRSGLRCDPA